MISTGVTPMAVRAGTAPEKAKAGFLSDDCKERQCLSCQDSGSKRQRQCRSRHGSGSAGKGSVLAHPRQWKHKAKAVS